MADVQTILADPKFHALPLEERRKVLGAVDPNFTSLSMPDQDSVLGVLATPSRPGSTANVLGMEQLGGSAPGHAPTRLPNELSDAPAFSAEAFRRLGAEVPKEFEKPPSRLNIAGHILASPVTGLLGIPGQVQEWMEGKRLPSGGVFGEEPITQAYGNALFALHTGFGETKGPIINKPTFSTDAAKPTGLRRVTAGVKGGGKAVMNAKSVGTGGMGYLVGKGAEAATGIPGLGWAGAVLGNLPAIWRGVVEGADVRAPEPSGFEVAKSHFKTTRGSAPPLRPTRTATPGPLETRLEDVASKPRLVEPKPEKMGPPPVTQVVRRHAPDSFATERVASEFLPDEPVPFERPLDVGEPRFVDPAPEITGRPPAPPPPERPAEPDLSRRVRIGGFGDSKVPSVPIVPMELPQPPEPSTLGPTPRVVPEFTPAADVEHPSGRSAANAKAPRTVQEVLAGETAPEIDTAGALPGATTPAEIEAAVAAIKAKNELKQAALAPKTAEPAAGGMTEPPKNMTVPPVQEPVPPIEVKAGEVPPATETPATQEIPAAAQEPVTTSGTHTLAPNEKVFTSVADIPERYGEWHDEQGKHYIQAAHAKDVNIAQHLADNGITPEAWKGMDLDTQNGWIKKVNAYNKSLGKDPVTGKTKSAYSLLGKGGPRARAAAIGSDFIYQALQDLRESNPMQHPPESMPPAQAATLPPPPAEVVKPPAVEPPAKPTVIEKPPVIEGVQPPHVELDSISTGSRDGSINKAATQFLKKNPDANLEQVSQHLYTKFSKKGKSTYSREAYAGLIRDRAEFQPKPAAPPAAPKTPPKVEPKVEPAAAPATEPSEFMEPQDLPVAKDTVSGLKVRDVVPNEHSIGSTLTNYEVLPGIREMPLSEFGPDFMKEQGNPPYGFKNLRDSARVVELAEQIQASGEINPLIIVYEAETGPYILEGGHRVSALAKLGKKSIPVKVVIDHGGGAAEATAKPTAAAKPTETPAKAAAETKPVSADPDHIPGKYPRDDAAVLHHGVIASKLDPTVSMKLGRFFMKYDRWPTKEDAISGRYKGSQIR